MRDERPTRAPSRSLLKKAAPWLVLVCAAGGVTWVAMGLGSSPVARRVASTPDARAARPPAVPARVVPPADTATAVVPSVDPTLPASTRVEPSTLDFGWLAPGEVRRVEAVVTNTGDTPISFTGNMKGCSCTSIEIEAGPLQPGASRPFAAIMTAGLTPTTKKSSLKLLLSTHAAIRIPVDGNIVRGLHVLPLRLAATNNDPDNPTGDKIPAKVRRVTFRSPTQTPFRVLSIDGLPVGSFPLGDQLGQPRPDHAFLFDDFDQYDPATGLDARGEMIPMFRLIETDHPGAEVIEVPIDHPARRATIERRGDRPWLFIENRYVVGPVTPGGSTVFEIPISWAPSPGVNVSPNEMVNAVESLSSELHAELLSVRKDGRKWKIQIRVTPTRTDDGTYIGRIRMHSDNYNASVPVIGAVRSAGPRT